MKILLIGGFLRPLFVAGPSHHRVLPARVAACKKAGSPVPFHRWHDKELDELACVRGDLPCETATHGSPWNGPFVTTF